MFRTMPLAVAALVLAACAGEPAVETAGTVTDPTPAPTAPATTVPGETPAAPTTIPTATDPTATDPAPTVPAVPVPEALQFSAPLVGGGELDLASLAGQRVLLWFWAPG